MSSVTSLAIALLIRYKYLILFPGIVLEGPILTMLGGFLASPPGGKVMNIFSVFVVAVLADLTGDVFYYSVGKWSHSKFLSKYRHFVGLTPARLEKLKNYFNTHGPKTIVLGKITHSLGWPAMVAAGTAKMPFGKFMFFNTIVSIIKTLILVGLGYYYGKSSELLFKYVGWAGISLTILVVGIVIYFFYARKPNRELQKEGF